MKLSPDDLALGSPYAIGLALVAALREAFAGEDVRVLDNPVRATDLAEGERVVFYEDMVDRFKDQNGANQSRIFAFNVGVVNRSSEARLGAHRDYRAAKRSVRAALKALHPQLTVISPLREGDVTFRVENIDVGGGVAVGSFTVEYRDPT
jgi:hypothetical protein